MVQSVANHPMRNNNVFFQKSVAYVT